MCNIPWLPAEQQSFAYREFCFWSMGFVFVAKEASLLLCFCACRMLMLHKHSLDRYFFLCAPSGVSLNITQKVCVFVISQWLNGMPNFAHCSTLEGVFLPNIKQNCVSLIQSLIYSFVSPCVNPPVLESDLRTIAYNSRFVYSDQN